MSYEQEEGGCWCKVVEGIKAEAEAIIFGVQLLSKLSELSLRRPGLITVPNGNFRSRPGGAPRYVRSCREPPCPSRGAPAPFPA